MQFFITALLLAIPYVFADDGDVIGNLHPDSRCWTKIYHPIVDNACTPVVNSKSAMLTYNTFCFLYKKEDCSDSRPKDVFLRPSCHTMEEISKDKFAAMKCFGQT
ncbi:hypothetical protein FQN49_006720 [Arthroderma sp. PD_2]|nr:hypothetical protein FQN49_006720 [Arthroderma sp. PD_2]